MSEHSIQAARTLDERSVNRIIRRIMSLRGYVRYVEQWATSEIRRSKRQEERLMQWFRPQLEAWARARLGNGRRRSIRLPAGTLGLRRTPARPVVVDQAEAMAWCREHLPEALRLQLVADGPSALQLREMLEQLESGFAHEEEIRKQVLTAHVKTTGECPPGVSMGGGHETFYIG